MPYRVRGILKLGATHLSTCSKLITVVKHTPTRFSGVLVLLCCPFFAHSLPILFSHVAVLELVPLV